MSIAENVAEIRRQMEAAALAAGRDPKEILLCAATKMNDADAVRQAIAAGVDCCGENRVQELTAKLAQNAYDGAPVHFIGHLQTNKVRQVVGKVSLIQSVDSARLLAAIDREAARQGIVQDILLEVNIGEEASKSGFAAGGHSSSDGKNRRIFKHMYQRSHGNPPNQPHFGRKSKIFSKNVPLIC
ncbi:MAG: alanine racemase [Oscillospiraceae bacterium]